MDAMDVPPDGHGAGLESLLAGARVKAASGSPKTLTIRELLRCVPAERRGARVVEDIQRALDRYELVTKPAFASGWIDNMVELRVAPHVGTAEAGRRVQTHADGDSSESADIALTVSSLESASARVASIERNGDLELARALMLRHDYSQLAVMAGARDSSGRSAGSHWQRPPSAIPSSPCKTR
jgi:hypothetical protein